MSGELDENYKSAFDGRLGFGNSSALILVDFVKAYFDENCPLYAGVDDALASALRVLGAARKAGLPVVAKRVVEVGPAELGIADSIGVAVPSHVSELVAALRDALGDELPFRIHLHNTRNTGLANAQAAVDAGVTSIDASIGAIGGYPFAPAATGNIPTDDLVYMLSRSGIDTGVSLDDVVAASRWLEADLGRTVPAMLPKAGGFPPAA